MDLLAFNTKYRRFQVLRAMQRRAHFKQTFKDMQHMRELRLKTKGQELRDLEIDLEDDQTTDVKVIKQNLDLSPE